MKSKKRSCLKLNKRTVDALSLPEKGQEFRWDGELKGFGVRLNPSGKTFVVQKRVDGILRRVSVGQYGVFTCEEARKKAVVELGKMSSGIDPVQEKKREVAYRMTLRQLADAYIADRRDLKASSVADINKHVDRSFAAWRERPCVEITRDKVAVRFREMSERSGAQANQAFRVLRGLMNYARGAYRPGGTPIIVENPCSVL